MNALYCSAAGRIIDIDRGLLLALRWERDAVVGQSLFGLIDPDDAMTFARAWDELVNESGATATFETRLRHGDDSLRRVALHNDNQLTDDAFSSVRTEVVFDLDEAAAAVAPPPPALVATQADDEQAEVEPEELRQAEPDLDDRSTDGAGLDEPPVEAEAGSEAAEDHDEADPFEPVETTEPVETVEPVEVLPLAAPAFFSRIEPKRVLELALLAAVVIGALLLRVWDLDQIPTGLHGDEATTGFEAERVRDGGWIGVYTPSALGQPTGPFYFTALVTALAGSDIAGLRLASALTGTATVLALWWAVRPRFGARVALFAAAICAVLNWHLHFSRIAFGVIWWPLVVVLAVGAIERATRSDERRWWIAAGVLTAIGVYAYNAHWTSAFALGLGVAIWAVHRARTGTVPLKGLGIWVGAALATLIPIGLYAADESNSYGNHFGAFSIRNNPEFGWDDRSIFSKGWLVLERVASFWNRLLVNPEGDLADGAGIERPVGLLVAALFVGGLFITVLWRRSMLDGLLLILVALLPLGAALTFDGAFRRTFALAPVIAVFGAIGLTVLHDWFRRRGVVTGLVAATLAFGLIGWPGVQSYFNTYRNNDAQQWTFASELIGPTEAIRSHPDAFVNFYSPRHAINYETVQYLADRPVGVDRSAEFGGAFSFERSPDVVGDQLFVLVGPYATSGDALASLHPDATLVADDRSGSVPYQAWLLADR